MEGGGDGGEGRGGGGGGGGENGGTEFVSASGAAAGGGAAAALSRESALFQAWDPLSLRPACPGTEIARAPHSRRARDLRGVGSPEGSGLFGRRPAARKEAGAAPVVSRCMGQQGAVASEGRRAWMSIESLRAAGGARAQARKLQGNRDVHEQKNQLMHELRQSGLFPKIFPQQEESYYEALASAVPAPPSVEP